MIASNPLLLFRICLVHEPPDDQSRHARPDPIGYIAYTDDDIIQAVIILEQGREYGSGSQLILQNWNLDLHYRIPQRIPNRGPEEDHPHIRGKQQAQ